ncbi:MAG TPA: lamin tail domain-containing protein [Candidatus Limnocylindrales bacterium]|nr:lamin tail domain-containing protein [Candidatus Limnocylindrales bacterium]
MMALSKALAQAPSITQEPSDQTIFYGDPATFVVHATGSLPLTYQWYRNGSAVAAATSSALAISAVSSNDQGAAFFVTVTNLQGSVTSQSAVLTVEYGAAGPGQTLHLLSYDSIWKYDQTDNLDEFDWKSPGYDDSAWPFGPGLLAAENNPAITPLIGTVLEDPRLPDPGVSSGHAYYFRTRVTLPADFYSVSLAGTYRCDDGAVIHLNGSESLRIRLPSGVIWNQTMATGFPPDSTGGTDATSDEPLALSSGLVPGSNLIAVEVHQQNSSSSDIVWGLALDATVYPRVRDTNAPTVARVIPEPGATVASLRQIEVHFSEDVKGVRATDLLINGSPATNLTQYAPYIYVFDFPQPAAGNVTANWNPAHTITDVSANSNRFAGGSYTFTLDIPTLPRSVRINEFMAANAHSIRDEDGQHSDWLELYNGGTQPVDLSGWYLTDNPGKLTKWRIPDGVIMASQSYLLIWASGLDRTNFPGPLHTNFKLDKTAGNSLDLVFSDGSSVLSSFSPYPQQYDDVSYGCDRLDPALVGYFTNATPNGPNSAIGPGFGPDVVFSVPGGSFQQPFALSLSTADTNAVIRYLLVTNGPSAVVTVVPNANSPIYTGPITISGSIQVRARAFSTRAGYFPGPLHNETYLQISPGLTSFSSDLPIVVFHDMGGGGVAYTADQFTTLEVFDTKNGRSSLLNPPDLVIQGYFHRRGQATLYNPKASLRVETQNAYGDDLDVELLGFPAENDWVFYGIDEFDKVLMHNPLAHELYRAMGHYTSHTRYVEVFLKDDYGTPGPITAGDYNGLYVLEEKIKIGKNRVDIDKLQPENTTAPSITGGYLLSIDKGNPGAGDGLAGAWVWYLDPDFSEVSSPAQRQYIQNYFNDFYNALMGPNWTDPNLGYQAYIGMDSWIDYHLHQTFVFNVDMLRISSYFYKPRNGKLVQGPLWDFDRAFADSDDGRGFNPFLWRSNDGDGGTDPFNPGWTFNNPWYGVMFTDPDFWQKWIDRYQDLRKTVYHLTNLMAQIDFYGNQVREATTREYARWRGSGGSDTSPRSGTYYADGLTYTFPTPGTWQGEINFVKYWFSNRVAFIDGNFLNPPSFSTNGGPVPSGFVLSINSGTVEPNSTIYYTLDGTDPRLPGGGINPAARASLNKATITVTGNSRIFARNWNGNHYNLTGPGNPPISSSWSGPTVATFVTATPPLRITEIMYNPLPPPPGGTNDNSDFEYIEFQNTAGAAINLSGYRLSGGIDFTFGNYVLGAGKTVLLVRNPAAFQSRYPGVTNVIGNYTNSLNNSGDHLILTGPLQEPILDFSFNDTWYPATDGLGFSLVIRDPNGPANAWNTKEGWRPSGSLNGSPGVAETIDPAIPGILITEALTHTDLPMVDTIELFNPTPSTVDLSGWFLTDDRHVALKYRIPNGTSIGPGRYLTFTTNQFGTGTNGFSLSSTGDQVYLFSGSTKTNLTGYAHGFDFGAAPNGISFGRYVNSQGDEQFVLQSANTLGTNNAYPRVGPIVFAEIMYHPPDPYPGMNDELNEYIELWNIAATNVPLYDPNATTNTWHVRNGVSFDFPASVSLDPDARLLVVGFDPNLYPGTLAALRNKYALAPSVPVFGPWNGKLNNGGDSIELLRPDNPNVTPTNTIVPYYLVEKIAYGNTSPWPAAASGDGYALQRIDNSLFGNDPLNWQAVLPFAGQPTVPTITVQPTNVTVFQGGSVTLVVAAMGTAPLSYQWYFNGTNLLAGATNSTLLITNAQLAQTGSYRVLVTNSVGSATSQSARLTVAVAPTITSQPADLVAPIGGRASFTVSASGSAPLSYNWFYNTNTLLPGAGADLTLFNVQPAQSGYYHVAVSNSFGNVASRMARLSVISPPVIDPGALKITGNVVSISIPSAVGVNYTLEYKDSLNDTTWIALLPATPGSGAIIVLSDTTRPPGGNRFYRLKCY